MAVVGIVGLVLHHFGKSLDATSSAELVGGIAAILAVIANLWMRDHKPMPPPQDSVSPNWHPPEDK